MKRFFIVLICFAMVLSLVGCKNDIDILNSDLENNSIADNNAKGKSIKEFFSEESTFSFEKVCAIEINHNNRLYAMKNTNLEYLYSITEYLCDCEVVVRKKTIDSTKKYYYIVLSSDNEIFSFYLCSDDTVLTNNKNYEEICLYKEGLFKEFENLLSPIMQICDKFYRVEYLLGQFKYKYEIFNNKGDTIISDTFPREPHISLRENNIVCMWTQAGTGTLVRYTVFYDVETSKKSPYYNGVVDNYNNLVLNSTTNSVIISDMFSGIKLQEFDKFKYKLYGGAIEPIYDARFIENGTKVSVTYRAEDSSEQTEIFDVVLSSEKDLPEWKKAYLDFLDDKDGEYLSFALVYIDNDDIPELYMSGCCEATGDSISSFKNGKIMEQLLNRTGGGRYIKNTGQIFNYNGNMGYYLTHVYKLNNDGFNQTFNAHLIEHLGDDKITYEYSVKDKMVSKEEYDAAINAVFNIDNSIRLNENAVSYDEIRRQILEY